MFVVLSLTPVIVVFVLNVFPPSLCLITTFLVLRHFFGSQDRFEKITDPKPAGFEASIFGYRVRVSPHREMGGCPVWDKSPPENRIHIVAGFRMSWEVTSVVTGRKHQQYKTQEDALLYIHTYEVYLLSKQRYHGCTRAAAATAAAAAVSRYALTHTSGLTTSRWDRIVIVTTTRPLPLSLQSRLQHSSNTKTHTTRCGRGRGRPPSATCRS